MTSTLFWVVVGVVVFLGAFQRRNLKRLCVAISAQFGKLFKWIWGIDPIAVYQAEVDRSAEEIQQAGEGLEQYRGLMSHKRRQVDNGEKEKVRLTQKIKSLLQEGDDNRASDYAVLLQKTETELLENKSQLASYDNAYQLNLKKVKRANEKIHNAKEKAEKMQAELRLSKAEAEVSKLAQSFNVTVSVDGLNEIEEEIQKQIDLNKAKGQVLRDLSQDGLDEMEEEENLQKAQAKELLEKFKTDMKK